MKQASHVGIRVKTKKTWNILFQFGQLKNKRFIYYFIYLTSATLITYWKIFSVKKKSENCLVKIYVPIWQFLILQVSKLDQNRLEAEGVLFFCLLTETGYSETPRTDVRGPVPNQVLGLGCHAKPFLLHNSSFWYLINLLQRNNNFN